MHMGEQIWFTKCFMGIFLVFLSLKKKRQKKKICMSSINCVIKTMKRRLQQIDNTKMDRGLILVRATVVF